MEGDNIMESIFNEFIGELQDFAEELDGNKRLRLIGICDTEIAIMDEVTSEKHTIMINKIQISTYREAIDELIGAVRYFLDTRLSGYEKYKVNNITKKYEEIKNEHLTHRKMEVS